jgi:serine/threonine protein kinase
MLVCPYCNHKNPKGTEICVNCAAPLTSDTLLSGTVLGTYRLDRVLGQGGFGITYRAFDSRLGRAVAIKEFFPNGSTRYGSSVKAPSLLNAQGFMEARQKFLEEARTLAQFNHPSIVRVFDVFEANNTAYLVMEALEGETLGSRLERQTKLEERQIIEIADRLCQALEVVHHSGLLHRDIKPDNIFLTNDSRVVLIDFGSARTFTSSRTMRHTQMVTPQYAAPEQYASEARFGAFTDIYGLSATLYHSLTGQLPPSAADLFAGFAKPLALNVSKSSLHKAIELGLRPKVDDRPSSVRDFARIILGTAEIQNSSLTSNAYQSTLEQRNIAAREVVLYKTDKLILTTQSITYFTQERHGTYQIKDFREVRYQPGTTASYSTSFSIAFMILLLLAIPGTLGFAIFSVATWFIIQTWHVVAFGLVVLVLLATLAELWYRFVELPASNRVFFLHLGRFWNSQRPFYLDNEEQMREIVSELRRANGFRIT